MSSISLAIVHSVPVVPSGGGVLPHSFQLSASESKHCGIIPSLLSDHWPQGWVGWHIIAPLLNRARLRFCSHQEAKRMEWGDGNSV